MSKSRTFSIYLLKDGFNQNNSLKDDNILGEPVLGNNLPEGAVLYILDKTPTPPWWKSYWGVGQDLYQVLKGAIVFLAVRDRCFVLTFGHIQHQLKDDSYEYDFGLITTLNALDPEKIKSTDILRPEKAKRERIQSPTASNLTFFDINKDESIIKKLTGAVKEEYKEILSNITGASNLRISSKASVGEILHLCEKILDIYNKEDFKETFPDIQNIVPVKDPTWLRRLNDQLVAAFNSDSIDLVLSFPEILDYDQSFVIRYSGAGRTKLRFDDVYIANYREYLRERKVETICHEDLKKHFVNLDDENGNNLKSISVLKSLIFDCELEEQHFHFCDGEWYRIEGEYLEKISGIIDPICIEFPVLEDCNNRKESDYNLYIAEKNALAIVCLDKTNIATSGNVEPCDLFVLEAGKAFLVHIKISTRSSSLSHLFNQGINSIQLMRLDIGSLEKLKQLLPNDDFKMVADGQRFEVVFGIITAKPKERKSKNLPIFSRISLVRTIKEMQLMAIPISIVFIKDCVDRKKVNSEEN